MHSSSLKIHLYLKKLCFGELFVTLFCHNDVSLTAGNQGKYFELVLETSQKLPASLYRNFIIPTWSEVLLFLHAITVEKILFTGGTARLHRSTQQVNWLAFAFNWCWGPEVYVLRMLVCELCQNLLPHPSTMMSQRPVLLVKSKRSE